MDIHVLHVQWSEQGERLSGLRERVFIEEQGVDRDIEWDGKDEIAEHFLALNEAGLAIGCARLLPEGQIGRMAVLAEHRQHGTGRRLLDLAVEHATTLGMNEVFLHAQTHAMNFYRKAGFQQTGDEFEEAGIPHVEMRLTLPIPFEADAEDQDLEVLNSPKRLSPGPSLTPDAAPQPADDEGSGLIQFDNEHDAREALFQILATARRTVEIFSPLLDHALFGDPRCIELISAFARRAPQALARILIVDSGLVVARGHPLLELARRLSSKIRMLKVPDNWPMDARRSFAVADGRAIWWLPDHDAPIGWAEARNPVQAQRVLLEFDKLFERAVDEPGLRLLKL